MNFCDTKLKKKKKHVEILRYIHEGQQPVICIRLAKKRANNKTSQKKKTQRWQFKILILSTREMKIKTVKNIYHNIK